MSDLASRRLELARHYSEIGQHERVLEQLDDSQALTEPEGWMLRGERPAATLPGDRPL